MTDPTNRPREDGGPVDEDGEPEVLGAAETVAYARSTRRESRQRRRHHRAVHRAGRAAMREEQGVVFVYEPHVRYVPPLKPYLRSLWERRAFALALARSKAKGARANTMLGGIWALLDPMFMVGIYYFVLTVLRGGARPQEFIVVLISGILHWQVSAAAMNEGGTSVAQAKSLMLNSTFPRMLLPLSAIAAGVIKFLPSVVVIFLSLVFLDGTISFALLWWAPLFVLQTLVSLGLALVFSTAIVFFADVRNVISYISRLLFFSCPIIFPLDAISEGILNVIRWSPFFGVFAAYQRILGGEAPDFGLLLISCAWAVASVLVGSWLFLRYEREFASRI